MNIRDNKAGLRPFYLYEKETGKKYVYELKNADFSETMPLRIRLETNQEKAGIRSDAHFVLRGHSGEKWEPGILTGLVSIFGMKDIYFGDHITTKGKNLLLIRMEGDYILIKYHRFFYSQNPARITHQAKSFFEESNQVFQNIKKGAETPFLKRSKSLGKSKISNSKI